MHRFKIDQNLSRSASLLLAVAAGIPLARTVAAAGGRPG